MLTCQKHLFSIPDDVTYLDVAYMSPIPKSAVEAGIKGVQVKAAPWEMTINSYYDDVEKARALAASFIGAQTDDIAIVPATSYGIALAAGNVPLTAGSVILMMENEHTSHRYAWYEVAKQKGARVVTVPRSPDETWSDCLVAAIRNSQAPVSVVAGTIVHWFEGTHVDIEAVAEASRAAGASLVMDGTQWVGAVPFDVTRVRPDFLTFATYKFLLGPYRLAFLYANQDWQKTGRPLEFHSWNRAGGERSDFYLETMLDYQPGARRFDMGERSDFAVLPIAIDSMQLLQQWGSKAVHERLLWLNRLIWQEAEQRGYSGPIEALRAGHISVVDLGERYRDDLARRLREQKAFVTIRGSKMRITPHVYNDEGDIRTLFEIIDTLTR
ncbi:aminotransferase class V-fold PLP-dependent enzyme [Rhizobium sp. CG5]|uniref:aminotransferase class V-fold PLP-dependent enzyme n=1 Tax=Rhizobium sp. CG5 TaxID=2726076 RepID=UPI0020348598|nr:aminotransferase class V-fold PLP-dependent enzyme [Rhizobium sp. CG5]MCM2474513.1 aminotransferase class V-fold PLP-dependent enzyme [Rhizobium sp. CG5]